MSQSKVLCERMLGPVVQKVSSGSELFGFGNLMFCYPGSGNPSYFCAGFSEKNWIGSP